MTVAPKNALLAAHQADAPAQAPRWAAEVDRLAMEVATYARGRRARLAGVSLRVPAELDEGSFIELFLAQLGDRGLSRPRVLLSRGPGRALLLSVEFAREPDGRGAAGGSR